MIRNSIVVVIALCLLTSCTKNKGEVITQQNVKDVLTRYGSEHKESEVAIKTEFGTMRIKLYDKTPLHRANFLKLISEDYYKDAEFYRIVNEFMIQGGDLQKRLDYTIPAEFKPEYYHKKGALAMARMDENNPGMESSSTEFYIIQGSRYSDYSIDEEAKGFRLTLTPEQRKTYLTIGGDMSLDQKYTVFGEVIEGFEVIDKIASVKVYNMEHPMKKIPLKITVIK